MSIAYSFSKKRRSEPTNTAVRSSGASNRISQGTLQVMGGRIISFGCGYLVAVILARGLGPATYGIYGVILSVLLWIEHIGEVGISDAAAKLIAEDQRRAGMIENTTQTLFLLIFMILFGVAWLMAPVFASLFQIAQGADLFRLVILDIPFTGIYFAYQGILAGRQEYGALSKGLAIYGLAKLTVVLISLLFGLSVSWGLIANLFGTVAAFLSLTINVPPATFRPSFVYAGLIFHLALPIGLWILATQVLWNLDLWCLKIFAIEKRETVGIYVAALNVARVPTMAVSAVNVVILSALAMALARCDVGAARGYVQGAGRFLWLMLLPVCILVLLNAEDLMTLLFSRAYSGGAAFLVLQVFGFALFVTAQAFGQMLIACGNPYLAAGAAFLTVPLSVLFNLALIPSFGAIGASVALVLAASLNAAIGAGLVYMRLRALIELSTLVRGALATAVIALLSPLFTWAGPWLLLKFSLLLIAYVLILFALRELKWEEVKFLNWGSAERERSEFLPE